METPAKTHDTVRGVSDPVRDTARVLRRTMTKAESRLWERIRARQLEDLKFRRQYAVGNFILDFYCADHKLAIEVDGSIHIGQEEHDLARTQFLQNYGYSVLRFKNEEVFNDIEDVLNRIIAHVTAVKASKD
jgi:very-short-patch-repair endonuclease